jgi:hypothetical protein
MGATTIGGQHTQKLVRLVRNCGIETVIGVAKEIPLRGLRRLSRGLLTHYETYRHSFPTWWCRCCGVSNDRRARLEGSDCRL